MVASVVLAGVALRAGVAARRARRRGRGRLPALRRAHLRVAKPAVAAVVVGFAGGPLSMWLLRDRAPFGTLHAGLGLLVVTLFAAAAVLGRRLESGHRGAAAWHGRLGLAAVLAAGAAAVAGFVLLP